MQRRNLKSLKNRKARKVEISTHLITKNEVLFRQDMQEYAQVTKVLGHLTVEANCFDGKTRICRIRGSMRSKARIDKGDVVLVSLREFDDRRADLVHKYTDDEALNLKVYGEIPEHVNIGAHGEDDDEVIDFAEDFESLFSCKTVPYVSHKMACNFPFLTED